VTANGTILAVGSGAVHAVSSITGTTSGLIVAKGSVAAVSSLTGNLRIAYPSPYYAIPHPVKHIVDVYSSDRITGICPTDHIVDIIPSEKIVNVDPDKHIVDIYRRRN
jgi:hypothetical protein